MSTWCGGKKNTAGRKRTIRRSSKVCRHRKWITNYDSPDSKLSNRARNTYVTEVMGGSIRSKGGGNTRRCRGKQGSSSLREETKAGWSESPLCCLLVPSMDRYLLGACWRMGSGWPTLLSRLPPAGSVTADKSMYPVGPQFHHLQNGYWTGLLPRCSEITNMKTTCELEGKIKSISQAFSWTFCCSYLVP